MSHRLYLWSLAICYRIISLITLLLTKHINHFIEDINFNDFIMIWNEELLGENGFTESKPHRRRRHKLLPFIYLFFPFMISTFFSPQFYSNSHFWIAVHGSGSIKGSASLLRIQINVKNKEPGDSRGNLRGSLKATGIIRLSHEAPLHNKPYCFISVFSLTSYRQRTKTNVGLINATSVLWP